MSHPGRPIPMNHRKALLVGQQMVVESLERVAFVRYVGQNALSTAPSSARFLRSSVECQLFFPDTFYIRPPRSVARGSDPEH